VTQTIHSQHGFVLAIKCPQIDLSQWHDGMMESHASFFSSMSVLKLAKMIFEQRCALCQHLLAGVDASSFDCGDVLAHGWLVG